MSAQDENGWPAANRASLAAELARLRAVLERRALPPTPDPRGPTSALDLLTKKFALSDFERDVLLLCAGAELDGEFAELLRAATGAKITNFGLALAALPEAHWSALAPTGPLRFWRLIEVRPSDTLTSAPLRIDERILHYLAGVPHLDERLHGLVRPYHDAEPLSAAQSETAQRLAALWADAGARGEPWPAAQLVGPEDAGAVAVASAACAARELGLCVMRGADLPVAASDRAAFQRLWEREAALGESGLLICVEDADGPETLRTAAAFAEHTRSAVILACREPLRAAGRPLTRLDLEKPPRAEQAALWRHALAPLAERLQEQENGVLDESIERLVNQFDLSPAAIDATAALVSGDLTETDAAATGELLWNACRAQSRARLDDLAQRLETTAAWDDLVLPAAQKAALREIVAQVRQRARVYDQWGFAAKSARGLGVSALFAGVSGTGKTLAAEIMAHELRLDLYRIDLSQVVSKYIGETEKNLRRVFEAAETAGAVLLFDEADALFGKRSEVKDSHDRYANMEVSYLLQRMESYRGLAILTTNMQQALDPAFKRRLRFIVHFPFPDEAERAEIWRRVFPRETPLDGVDVAQLARLNVAGGNIRNIALGAAFLAADERSPVRMAHLLRTARAECAKLERPLTDGEIRGWA
ncbi:MAG: ATP-binding protein [Methylocystis sp.]|nr:ATP-binding protein [Methylocystis sp.]